MIEDASSLAALSQELQIPERSLGDRSRCYKYKGEVDLWSWSEGAEGNVLTCQASATLGHESTTAIIRLSSVSTRRRELLRFVLHSPHANRPISAMK